MDVIKFVFQFQHSIFSKNLKRLNQNLYHPITIHNLKLMDFYKLPTQIYQYFFDNVYQIVIEISSFFHHPYARYNLQNHYFHPQNVYILV